MHLMASDGTAERDQIKQTQPYPVKAGTVDKQLSSALISSSNISTADSGLDSSRVLKSTSHGWRLGASPNISRNFTNITSIFSLPGK